MLYSNSNWLLSYIIEQVSGKSYQQATFTENIFQTAGLTSTYYESSTDLIPNRVSGYSFRRQIWNPDFISMSLCMGRVPCVQPFLTYTNGTRHYMENIG